MSETSLVMVAPKPTAALHEAAGDAVAAKLKPAPAVIKSSGEFVRCFVPPDYLIEGVLQRRYIYSFTGATGAGKTAVALRLAAHVALGRGLGDHEVEKGPILYLAGENPDDIRMRWIALAEQMQFDLNSINVHFLEPNNNVDALPTISNVQELIASKVKELGGVILIIVDTSAAYFDGDDENNNVQMLVHARKLRTLATLVGKPTVVVLSHPTKKAKREELVPRGGGAFLNEVDGNIAVIKDDTVVTLKPFGKFRGVDFGTLDFELPTVTAARLKDGKGRSIPTVVAIPLSEEERDQIDAIRRGDQDQLLILMLERPGLSFAEMAKASIWLDRKGQPNKSRVQKAMSKLKDARAVEIQQGRYTLTVHGKQRAQAAKVRQPHLPSVSADTPVSINP